MKRLIPVALLAALAATPAASMQGYEEEAAETDPLIGRFAGSYTCQDGEHGIYLQFSVDSNDGDVAQVSGVLSFFPTVAGKDASSGMVTGSFLVSGAIAKEDKSIYLEPQEWLLQPDNYGAAALEGKFEDTEIGVSQIVGKPVVPGNEDYCSDLILTEIVLDDTNLIEEGESD